MGAQGIPVASRGVGVGGSLRGRVISGGTAGGIEGLC
jgi:hypothetical protein